MKNPLYDSILDLPITESTTSENPLGLDLGGIVTEEAEYKTSDPAINPTKDQPHPPDAKISIPGGDGEKPTAKPVEGSNPSIPGGSHTPQPSGTNPKAASPSITSDAYNQAIRGYQKSFEEAAKGMAALAEMSIIYETAEDIQEGYAEMMMIEAYFGSYIDGPYFESLNRSDKGAIRKAISAVRKAYKSMDKDDYNLRLFDTNTQAAITGAIIGVIMGVAFSAGGMSGGAGASLTGKVAVASAAGSLGGNVLGKAIVRGLREDKKFKTSLWQMVGCFNASEGSINEAIKFYTNAFKEELGGCVINAMKLKVKDRNVSTAYVLLIDSNKEAVDTITIEPKGDPKKEDKKGEKPIKESGADESGKDASDLDDTKIECGDDDKKDE